MCTRFYIDLTEKELQEIVSAAEQAALTRSFLVAGDPLCTSGEIYPTNVVPVIASSRSGKQTVFPMKWGYSLKGRYDDGKVSSPVSRIFNARSETASIKETFRDSWKNHRCIIPSSYYFEWEHRSQTQKIKYAIQPKGASITWLCGLYRIEDGFPHFVVLTKSPAKNIAFIHDRMPLILPGNQICAWIDPRSNPDAISAFSLDDMIYEKCI